MFLRARGHWLALLGVLLVGFGLRVYHADHQEIWGDEGAKLEVVNQDVAHLFDPAAEVHPRFFHVNLFLWFQIFHYNVFGLRMLPVLFGVLGLPLLYGLGRALFASRTVGLVAMLLLALSPFHVAYSQDLTMYTLLFIMVTLSFYLAIRAWQAERASAWVWVGYVIATALMLHTHYYSIFALAAQNAVVLWRYRHLWLKWGLAQAAIAALILPWFAVHYPRFANQAVNQTQDWTLTHLGEILTRGGLGFTVGATFPAVYAWLGWGYVALALAALVGLWRSAPTRSLATLLGVWLLLPPVFVWVFDLWLQHFHERFLSVSLPPLLILIAVALVRMPALKQSPGRLGAMIITLVYGVTSLISLRAWYFDPAYLKSFYGEAMTYIADHALSGDALLLNGPEQRILFDIYGPTGLPARFISPNNVFTDMATERDLPGLVAGYQRIWLVMFGATETYDPEHRAEAWLGTHGYKTDFRTYAGLYWTLYVLRPEEAAAELTSSAIQFAGGPQLIGYAFEPAVIRPGETLYITLEWKATVPIERNYTVFTHLWNQAGIPVAQSDSEPVSGTRPTSTWQVGDVIQDRLALVIPPETVAGDEYTLNVGLYHWPSLERLTITQPGGEQDGLDHAKLGTIQVVP